MILKNMQLSFVYFFVGKSDNFLVKIIKEVFFRCFKLNQFTSEIETFKVNIWPQIWLN